jgi:hypothetical protein
MSEEKCIGATARESKHIVLNNSLRHLQDVMNQAEGLLSQITQAPENDASIENCKQPDPSLYRVLDETPDTIRNKCNEISDILTQIKDSIF